MIFSQRRGNVLFGAALAGMLAILLIVSPAQALIYQWTGASSSDMLTAGNYNVWDGTNWSVSAAVPGAADNLDFVIDGSSNPNPVISGGTLTAKYIEFGDETIYPDNLPDEGGPARTFTGDGTITIASNGNIDSWLASGPVTFSNAALRLTRGAALYAGGGGGSSAAELVINTTNFYMGVGGSSGNPVMAAVGADITVYPAVDFSLNTYASNRQLDLRPSAGRTITLTNGVADTPKLRAILGNGETGGTTILGNSTAWAGVVAMYTSDIEINHNDSLGAVGDMNAGYTEPGGAAYTSALVLTNNITSGEFIWFGARSADNTAALIKNKSGTNTLSGTLQADGDGVGTDHNYTLQSDGTLAGDLFKITGTIQTTPEGYAWQPLGPSNLALQGAGDGLVTGNIIELNSNIWNLVKKSSGIWTLSGANTYTGSTSVEEGKLLIDGTHVPADASTAVYDVLAAGTLGGTGSIQANATVAGALAPGASIGEFSVDGDVTLTGTLDVEYSGAGAGSIDLLNVAGLLDLTGSTINFSDYDLAGSLTGAAYVFATYGSLAGTSTEVGVPVGYSVDYGYGGNSIALVVVPEPSTMILLVLAGLALAAYRRRVR